ncbi:hypothetical protein OHA25_57730 [Nonomuraea sp. NBC_00507]
MEPVQQRRPLLVAAQRAPCAQQRLLQRLLGFLQRAEFAVGHETFTARLQLEQVLGRRLDLAG